MKPEALRVCQGLFVSVCVVGSFVVFLGVSWIA